ncbi:hypothetical protein GWI33_006647 [Rhynchophorus ferrugineus]|uniref:Uncharacterized protein n=1 Tax=Rhynchophorus ferrugineus TaxID=354439 RepID=A0A834MFB8_RHYFE|nr:hypothetical protein GWI33_006647 [Rhynchophorus ferrugineus]
MDSDNTSLRSSKKEDAPEKKVGFARPTLVIPNQPHQRPTTLDIPSEESAPPGDKSDPYGIRKQSVFIFDQINGLRDFTVSSAKTGLGFGEKSAYWLYNKVRVLSRKWFTHCFLSIVLIIYTIGGAVSFQTLEGKTLFQELNN